MLADPTLCDGCGRCVPYCPVGALSLSGAGLCVDRDRCVECGTCTRPGTCPQGALQPEQLPWSRLLRARFSNPLIKHPDTGVWGRGTTEMKTADVSDRVPVGQVAFAIEVGRPGISASLADVELVATSLAGRVRFVQRNPVTHLIDPATGRLRDSEVGAERVLSAIVEFTAPEEALLDVLACLRDVAGRTDTVFSVCVICRCDGGEVPLRQVLTDSGHAPRPNGKVNVGLGRPLA